MTRANEIAKEGQDAYFHLGVCPFCGSPEICVFPWGEVDALAESRDVLCHDCKAEWAEVNCPVVGHRFLEKHKLNTYEVGATVTVTHRLLMRIRARNEAEAVGKAQVMDLDKIVEDDHWQVVSVNERSVKPVEEPLPGE